MIEKKHKITVTVNEQLNIMCQINKNITIKDYLILKKDMDNVLEKIKIQAISNSLKKAINGNK